MTIATRILKINMKCHLKQNDHSFYHHIPIFNYGEFSYYAYITIIIVITICAMVKCKPKCFLHFLEKFLCNNSQFPTPAHSQYIRDSFTYVSTRSHLYVYANMTWQHHSSWSIYGQITCWTRKHAFMYLAFLMTFKPHQKIATFWLDQ